MELQALIVDDDKDFRDSVAMLVEREGYRARRAPTLAAAREELHAGLPDVVLLDLVLPDGDGLQLMEDAELADLTEFVVMTGHSAVDSAVTALRDGALDYLPKPIDQTRLRTTLTNVARTRGLKREVSELRAELRGLGRFGSMVGRSAPMQEVYDLIVRVAPTDSTVFITGESGTGKELVAETIHRLSRRRDHPFLVLNCGAMSESLIESELFGHEKGSFTGADRRRRGYFEEASGGTLFLDEISEMPPALQVTLLRVLESGSITRVGTSAPVPVNVRVLAASNREPAEAVRNGQLREDLLYRLNVFPIHLPPLRERGEDIELLARCFLDEVNRREVTSRRLGGAAVQCLVGRPWPGNVRELKNGIERAAILADDEIRPEHLPEAAAAEAAVASGRTLEVSVGSALADAERRIILATLDELHGDKKKAATVLGISLKTLYNRLNLYHAIEKVAAERAH